MKNGVAVLESTVSLPDGTPVRVEVERTDSSFWNGRSVEEMAQDQNAQPIYRADELAIDWPAEDSLDELQSLIREARA